MDSSDALGTRTAAAPVPADGAYQAIAGVVRLLAEVRLAVLGLAVVVLHGPVWAYVAIVATVPFSYVPARSWDRRGQMIARSGLLVASDLFAAVVVYMIIPAPLSGVYAVATAALLGAVIGRRSALMFLSIFVPLMLPLARPDDVLGWARGGTVLTLMALMVQTGETLAAAMHRQWTVAQQDAQAAARRAATLERVRIARDIHDTVAGDLAGTILIAQVLRDRLAGAQAPTDLRATADQLVELCQGAHRASRAAISELRRAEERPADQLADLCSAWSARSGVACELALTSDLTGLDEAVLTDLRVMTTELLENARRHAEAARVDVLVSTRDDVLELTVVDDGVGLPEATPELAALARDGHFGLAGLNERVAEHGGEIRWSTTPGGGLTTRVLLPVRGGGTDDGTVGLR